MRPPRWQELRKAQLQSACNEVAKLRRQGIPLLRAIKSAAAEYRNTDLGDGRRLKLSEKTLCRLWYAFQQTKDPSVFDLKYKGPGRATIDPLLLRMVVEYSLDTGSGLGEAIEAIRPPGAKLTVRQLYSAFPKRSVDSLSHSHKRLLRQRARLEQTFLASDARFRRSLLRQRAEFQNQLLREDKTLRSRILRQRETLQRKFLQADAAAVRRRAAVHQRVLQRSI